MKGEILMTANNEKRKSVKKDLISICNFICDNYMELKSEFNAVEELLQVAETCGIAYKEKNMVAMHLKNVEKGYKYMKLEALFKMVKNVNKASYMEFVQNVDFLNIFDVLIKQNNEGAFVPFVWEVQRKQKHIEYQIERIVHAKSMNKKVAILKGMMAYC